MITRFPFLCDFFPPHSHHHSHARALVYCALIANSCICFLSVDCHSNDFQACKAGGSFFRSVFLAWQQCVWSGGLSRLALSLILSLCISPCILWCFCIARCVPPLRFFLCCVFVPFINIDPFSSSPFLLAPSPIATSLLALTVYKLIHLCLLVFVGFFLSFFLPFFS